MDGSDPKRDGWTESLRRMADSILGLAETRVELFAVELREEKRRALKLLAWLGVGLLLAGAGLLIGLGTLAFYLWTLAGYWGPIGLMLAALAVAVALVWRIRHELQTEPAPFAETVAEFKKDRECLRSAK